MADQEFPSHPDLSRPADKNPSTCGGAPAEIFPGRVVLVVRNLGRFRSTRFTRSRWREPMRLHTPHSCKHDVYRLPIEAVQSLSYCGSSALTIRIREPQRNYHERN